MLIQLTLEHLIVFIADHFKARVTPDTIIRDITNKVVIDGDEIYFLFKLLEKRFNVSFDNFDFKKYFLQECEISKVSLLFGFSKKREITHQITIIELYEYMIENKNKG